MHKLSVHATLCVQLIFCRHFLFSLNKQTKIMRLYKHKSMHKLRMRNAIKISVSSFLWVSYSNGADKTSRLGEMWCCHSLLYIWNTSTGCSWHKCRIYLYCFFVVDRVFVAFLLCLSLYCFTEVLYFTSFTDFNVRFLVGHSVNRTVNYSLTGCFSVFFTPCKTPSTRTNGQ